MITTDQGFMVLGDPVGEGRMKCIGGRGKVKHQLIHDDPEKKLEHWRTRILAGALKHLEQLPEPYEAVTLTLTWSVERPAGHWGTGRNAEILKPSAPRYPTTKGSGDVDKLMRAILDGLSPKHDPKWMPDDAQVVDSHLYKRYATERYGDPLTARPDPYDVLPVPGVVVRFHPHTED